MEQWKKALLDPDELTESQASENSSKKIFYLSNSPPPEEDLDIESSYLHGDSWSDISESLLDAISERTFEEEWIVISVHFRFFDIFQSLDSRRI